MKIYIATALTHVPREMFESYTSFIHLVASELKTNGHDVRYALVNSDPQLAEKPVSDRARLCYIWDRKMVEESDLVIADASFPSTGLGIELQIAESRGIPIILCFKDYGSNMAKPVVYENPDHSHHDLQIGEGYVSLMALGIPGIFRIVKYRDHSDGIRNLLDTLEHLINAM